MQLFQEWLLIFLWNKGDFSETGLAVLKSQTELNTSSLSVILPHLFLSSLSSLRLPLGQTLAVPSSVFNLSSRLSAFSPSHWESSPPSTVIFLCSLISLSLSVGSLLQTAWVRPGSRFVSCWRGSAISGLLKSLSLSLYLPPSPLLPASVAGSLYFTLTKKSHRPLILISRFAFIWIWSFLRGGIWNGVEYGWCGAVPCLPRCAPAEESVVCAGANEGHGSPKHSADANSSVWRQSVAV